MNNFRKHLKEIKKVVENTTKEDIEKAIEKVNKNKKKDEGNEYEK